MTSWPVDKKRNVILGGMTSGFGLSRTIRSRFHRAYDRSYRDKHRMPRLVFAFDLLLGAVVVSLLVLTVSLIIRPPEPPTLDMAFASPVFEAGKATPMAVRLWPTDGRDHANVSVQWHVPSGWEVLESSPPMRRDGTVILGTVQDGQEGVSRLVVRMFGAVGSESAIQFTVRNTEGGMPRTYTGIESRQIAKSAVTAEVPSAFQVDGVNPEDAVVPIQVTNHTDRTMPFVEIRPTEASSVQFSRVTFGDLPAGASRFAYIPLGNLSSPPMLEWALFAASREIVQGSWSAPLFMWNDPVVERPLVADPRKDSFARAHGGEGISLIIVQPFFADAVHETDVRGSDEEIFIPATTAGEMPQQQWFAAPVLTRANGDRILGPATFGVFTGALPLSAEVRYLTDAGDQVGMGPNPPRAGEETRYWMFWNLGPVQGALRNVQVQTTVPDGIRLTGSIAVPDGGSSSVSGRTIRWSLPEIGTDAGVSEALFGFEISLIPTERDIAAGHIPLSGVVEATAIDVDSGLSLRTEKKALYSENIDEAN